MDIYQFEKRQKAMFLLPTSTTSSVIKLCVLVKINEYEMRLVFEIYDDDNSEFKAN